MLDCIWCHEPVTVDDKAPNNDDLHHACLFRMVAGSVAHQTKKCSCFVIGSTCGDPPELTRRQAAQAALDLYRHNHHN